MMPSSLRSLGLLAIPVILSACATSWDSAHASTAIADDGASLIVVVYKEHSERQKLLYESTTSELLSSVGWIVPIPGHGAGGPRVLRDFDRDGPRPDQLYAMLTAGYVLLDTRTQGRVLQDVATGTTRALTAPGERPNDYFVPSRDGRYIAHFIREEATHCEWGALPCVETVEFLDAATLTPGVPIELSFPAPAASWVDPFFPLIDRRFAWTAAGTLRVTYSSMTLDVSVSGVVREVPFERCYYAATSSGVVSLSGETVEQQVTPEGHFGSILRGSVFSPTDGEPTTCVLPRE